VGVFTIGTTIGGRCARQHSLVDRSLLFGRINQEWNRQFQHSLPGFEGQFIKSLLQGGIEWKGYRLGGQMQQEQNTLRRGYTLSFGAYAWNQQGVYIESVDSSTWYFHLRQTNVRITLSVPTAGCGFPREKHGRQLVGAMRKCGLFGQAPHGAISRSTQGPQVA
jgi:hypothetical protein